MPESADSTPEKADLEKIAKLLDVQYQPPLDAGDIQSLNKSLPGYQAITDDIARFVEKHGGTLNLDPDVLVSFQQGLADVQRLEPAEHLLEKLHTSVYHQRLQATSQCRQEACGVPPAGSGNVCHEWPTPISPMLN
uniref:Uncharacterized protein n=1 Tax=Candidatus Kentrum sp. FW TaxID=2126338 RepID=A0A450SU88_9GAMM|nr:MAG: hypothetical protein BECKFW1821B_GA0114236_10352 [Candidatus Kentron sp. FW]